MLYTNTRENISTHILSEELHTFWFQLSSELESFYQSSIQVTLGDRLLCNTKMY